MAYVTDAHGIRLHYELALPAGRARGIVHVLHGVGEHSRRYIALVEALVDSGWLVIADDHRGHGVTGLEQHHGDRSKLGKLGPGGHPAAVNGVDLITQTVRREHPGLPVVLFGHSWGSFIAQILLNRHPEHYAGCILSGSALRMPGSVNSGDLNARWRRENSNGMEWLSEEAGVQQAFIDDPDTTSTPLLRLFGPLGALDVLGRPERGLVDSADVALLLLVGRDDPVGGPLSVHRLAEAYRKRAGLTDVTTFVYSGRHEILNEAAGPQVRADILAWLDGHIERPVRAGMP